MNNSARRISGYRAFAMPLIFGMATSACAIDCEKLSEQSKTPQNDVPLTSSGREVIGEADLVFYTGPSEQCRILDPDMTLKPGVRLNAYFEVNGFSNVLYFSDEGDQFAGWVLMSRLKETNQGVRP